MKSILITSSILIVLIAALRPILRRRIDPRVQYALWLIAALRLLVPVELAPSAYSALALLERAEEPARVVEAIGQTTIPAQSYDSAHAQIIEQYRMQGVDTAQLSPRDLMDIDTQARELTRGPTLAELASKYAKPVWLGGAAVMALWFLLVNARLRRKLSRAELMEIEESCGLPVFVSGALPSPCLCGVFRPAVFVTPAAAEDPDRMRHVLAHETTHYRHRDHWWALVRCLCLCLYWFDPLVWWAAAMSRQDCELACDAGAIRRLGEEERLAYGRTLVAMIAAGRNPLLQTATTMTGGRRRVRERVDLIARKPKTVIALALALVLVLGLTVGFTFTGAPEKSMDSDAPTLDTLQARLTDLPEELQGTVAAATGNGSLVEYTLNVPGDWTDEHYSYVLSVHSFQKEGFQNWPAGGEDIVWEIAAQDDTRYYAIRRLREQIYPSEYEYWDTHRAVRAFVEETLLATEGVEPYGQSLDTLQSRLLDVPEELRADVEALSGSEPTATLNRDFTALAQYWMNRSWADYDDIGMGWLLTVYQWDQEQFEQYYPDLEVTGGVDCFARDDNFYYVIFRATDARAPMSETGYADAFDAILTYAMEQVLATEGVEPYASLDTLRARLNNVPLELQADVVTGPGHSNSPTLVTYWMNRDWTNKDNSGLGFLLRVDEMSQAELDEYRSTGGSEVFARSGGTYYAILYATDVRYYSPDDAEPFHNAFDAIRAYAMAQVLATDGVEPFTLGQPMDTLQERLESIPEELRGEVALSHPDAPQTGKSDILAAYILDNTDPEWGNRLLTVRQLDHTGFEYWLHGTAGYTQIFARDSEYYYALSYPSDVQYRDEDASRYAAASEAIGDYAMKTVLDTEGVEPFTPDSQSVPELVMPSFTIDGLDYTMVTSYEDVPEDPEQWYLVGQLHNQPLWMFTRDRGAETMFQIDGELTQVFPYRACYYGGPHTHDGRAPQLMRLWGSGNGNGTYDGAFAVITHLFQGGTDQMYQLTVYDLDTDPVTAYVHDMKPLMDDFNQSCTSEVHPDRRTVSLSYGDQTAEITFHEGDALWDSILEYGFSTTVWDTCYSYSFNDDGTANLIMPIDGPMVYSACWTLRFTGSGFEVVGFQFVGTSF